MSLVAFRRPRAHLDRFAHLSFFGRLGRFAVEGMTVVGTALIFLISDMLLAHWGFNYGEAGGSFIEKVHPGTWILIGALLFVGIGRGNPLTLIGDILAYPGLAWFLAAWSALLVWSVAIINVPFTPLIDTFLMPIVLFLLLREVSTRTRKGMALMVHAILVANALLGIAEYIGGWRLTPYMIASVVVDVDWRSTAFFGHPLGNASMTGAYIVALVAGGGRDLPRLAVPAILILEFTSMIAFGGRSSLAIALLIVLAIAAIRGAAILRGGRFGLVNAALTFAAVPFAVAALAVVAQSGFFDLFVDRLASDSGSAESRVIMLQLFHDLPLRDLLLGPDQAHVVALQNLSGIELGIESFWVGFIMVHGIFMAGLFFLGLGAFCWQLVVSTQRAALLPVIFYFIVASTAVSLSAKTVSFGMFVALVMTLLRRDEPDLAGAARRRL